MGVEADGAIRVIVVDDHAVVRSGLRAFLNGEPDLVVLAGAADGEEALETIERLDAAGRRPDVVVMDLKMERGDGIEATREIRARYDDVKVVVLTSFGDDDRVHAALRAGASGYLLKDADADEVAFAVRAAHRGELQLDPAVAGRLTASLLAPASGGQAATPLTPRELDVLRLIAAGEPNKAIAAALGISERTTRSHVSSILSKLNLTSRTQAALWAAREGVADGRSDGAARV
jgi:DNA-binding NarL/FixJ family response regulator